MSFKSPKLYQLYEEALLADKQRVIDLFTAQGKIKDFEDQYEYSLGDYLDNWLTYPGIFEAVCDDNGVTY